jgi:hypothetical protein
MEKLGISHGLGGQPQLSMSLASQASEMMSIRELQIWIVEHLQTKLLLLVGELLQLIVRERTNQSVRGGGRRAGHAFLASRPHLSDDQAFGGSTEMLLTPSGPAHTRARGHNAFSDARAGTYFEICFSSSSALR